jgi:hypothetical protein
MSPPEPAPSIRPPNSEQIDNRSLPARRRGTRSYPVSTALPGKQQLYRDGRIREIADYCETHVVNTYRVWLRYELFRGRLTDAEFRTSEDILVEFIRAHGNTKPHLAGLIWWV